MLNRFITRSLLCLAIGTSATYASADEPQDIVSQIASTAALPCTEGALSLFNEQIVRIAPLGILDGVRRRVGLGAEWGPGNENFEQARAVVTKAVSEDVTRNGPLINVTTENLMRAAFASKSIEDIRYFGKFFSSPAGLVYWQSMIDGAQCGNWLESLEKPPFLPFTAEQTSHRQRLQILLNGGQKRFSAQFNALSKAEKSNFDTGYKKIGNHTFNQAFIKLGTSNDAKVKTRVKQAIEPYMPEIMQIIQKYSARN